ncbi:MAG: amidophosphoribosyltransferase [Clostridia bacterium]|nr:amidophosphoribosyltransferase [Clostridia bacterium]
MKNTKIQYDKLDSVELYEDKLHEECGVFGITSPGADNLAKNVYFGLHGLQHRGQESAGIASNMYGNINYHKDMGLVQEVFNDDIIRALRGDICIGHVRYSTAGGGGAINSQPLVVYSKKGSLALAHNGNLTNAQMLRDELEENGYIFQTTIDTETIAALVARYLKDGTVEDAIHSALNRIEGAYALVITTANKLIGVRDPNGLRPLCLGRLTDGKGYVLSSESCTFPLQGAEFVRDIEPGEMVIIQDNEVSSRMFHPGEPKRVCSFEYVYFARTDSRIDGRSVYASRIRAGEILAKEDDVKADLVIAVPDSGTAAAIGYSHGSGVPFGEGLVKNRYVGRTFIQPTQEMRELSVKMKLNVLEENVKGKSIVVIDDSVVRGTTSGKIVKMLKDAGAAEIHMRISSPPVKHSCYMGIDTPDRSNLMAANHSIDEMCKMMGADTLRFLSVEGLKESIGFGDDICTACFTGDYPVKLTDVKNKLINHEAERSFVGEYD